MLLEIFDIEPLKNFFDVIYDTSLTSIELKLDPEKLSINLLNNSHVAFYNLELYKDYFEKYETEVDSVVIDLDDFYKILKSAGKNDVLTIESNDSYLHCVFENNTSRRVFEIPLVEESYNSAVPPSIDYQYEFTIPIMELKQPCTDLDKIIKTDRFRMSVMNDELVVSSPKDAMAQYSNNIMIDKVIEDSVTVTVNVHYIMDLLKLSKIDKEVLFKVGDDMPLSWFISSVDDCVKVSGLIAPILEQED